MIIRSTTALVVAVFVIAATPATGAMSVSDFLSKASKLEKKGPLALFSKDMKLLKNEGNYAGTYYKKLIEEQKKRGQTLHSCPPKNGSMNSDELLKHLRKIPKAQQQTMLFRDGFLSLMKKKYPC